MFKITQRRSAYPKGFFCIQTFLKFSIKKNTKITFDVVNLVQCSNVILTTDQKITELWGMFMKE